MAAALPIVGAVAVGAVAVLAWTWQHRTTGKLVDDLRSVEGSSITLTLIGRQQGSTTLFGVSCRLISIDRRGLVIEPQEPLPRRILRRARTRDGAVVVPLRMVALADTPRGRVSAAGWDTIVDIGGTERTADGQPHPPRAKAAGGRFGPGSPLRLALVVPGVALAIVIGLLLPGGGVTLRAIVVVPLAVVVLYLARRNRV